MVNLNQQGPAEAAEAFGRRNLHIALPPLYDAKNGSSQELETLMSSSTRRLEGNKHERRHKNARTQKH